MSAPDLLLLAVLALGVLLAVRHIKRSGGCTGCNGNCAACQKKGRQ